MDTPHETLPGYARISFSANTEPGESAPTSKWATLKLKRSWWLFNELLNRVDIWNATSGFIVPIRFSSDRTAIEFLSPSGFSAPTDEWALLLGDAIHNARAALDAVVWELAHLNGARPRQPHRVGFPVTTSEEAWKKAVGPLESVPEVFLERIRSVQPWVDVPGPEADGHWLQLLSRLDNDDKHRGSVVAIPTGESIRLQGMNIRLGEATETGGFMGLSRDVLDDPPPAGEVFGRFSFGATVTDDSTIPETAQIELHAAVRFGENAVGMAGLHTTLIPYLDAMITMVESGSWPRTADIHPQQDWPHASR